MTRSAAVRRELPASRHVPYAAHVAPEVIVTTAGDYVQTFRLSGASYESADDETLNNWHERLNVTWRNIASPNVALWTHLVRRRDVSLLAAVAGTGFADRLARRYQARLATEPVAHARDDRDRPLQQSGHGQRPLRPGPPGLRRQG